MMDESRGEDRGERVAEGEKEDEVDFIMVNLVAVPVFIVIPAAAIKKILKKQLEFKRLEWIRNQKRESSVEEEKIREEEMKPKLI